MGCSFDGENSKLFVIGIGASTGGLKAIDQFFENMPADSGAAFVVVLHLSPNFKSTISELFGRHTPMEIYRVTDGMELAPNSIYFIPPNKNLIIEENKLRFIKPEDGKHLEANLSIDLFFYSLAQAYKENAIAVVLSGSGRDGSLGLQAISEAGGMAFIQEGSTTEFDSMPWRAIPKFNLQKTQVDSPGELARAIYQFVVSPTSIQQEYINSSLCLDNIKLDQITEILSQFHQVDFSNYKPSTLSRRIYRRCSTTYCQKIEEYIEFLQESDEEKQILLQDLLINVTQFFRDALSWEFLSTKVIPDLIEKSEPDEELRFWVTGCATGEEAYSLAIIIDEALNNSPKKLPVKIFATDIDKNAIEKAALGVYPTTITNDVNPQRLEKYFISKQDSFQVRRKLREMLIFAAHDLTKDPGFTRINLITCRNTLIYMQPELQYKVLQNLHLSLKNQGILFLGDAEHPVNLEDEFIPINRKYKLYRKRRDIRLDKPIVSLEKFDQKSKLISSSIYSGKKKHNQRELILEKILKNFLDANQVTCLLVDKNNQVVEIFEDLAKVLKFPVGKLTNDVKQLVLPCLQLPLNMALHRVRTEKNSVTYKGIKLVESENIRIMQLKVNYYEDTKFADDILMVSFQEEYVSMPVTESENFKYDSQEQISQLEYQLQQTKESLETAIEKLESTNEELQSVNEELYTVNSEYKLKINELIELNEDINNLLRSTNIGVVFLDKQLIIRKFTPAATIAINLIETDINRPLKHLSHNLDCDNFLEIIKEITQNEKSLDLEVKLTDSDRYLLMRINPYVKDNGNLDGVVLSFIDINEIKTAQNQLQDAKAQLNQKQAEFEAIFNSLPDALIFTDKTRHIRMLNPGFTHLFGYDPQDLIGQYIQKLYVNSEDDRTYKDELIYANSEKEIKPCEIDFRRRDRKIFVGETLETEVKDSQGNVFGYLKLIRDISSRKQAEAALLDSEERFHSLYLRTPVMLHSIDANGRILDVSNYWLDKLGYKRQEVIGKKLIKFLTSESRRYAQEILPEFFHNGSCWHIPYQFIHKNGEAIDTLLSAIADKDDRGNIIRILAVIIDITEGKKAEAALKESEARFKIMADSAPVLIWMSDINRKGVFFNKAWLEFTDGNLEQQLGDGWLENIYLEDRHLWDQTLCNGDRGNQPIELQFRIRGVDGQYYWMLGKQVPRFNSQGEIIGYIASCIDISEIKNAKEIKNFKEQFYQANNQLEKSTIELSRAEEAAESANQATSSFIADMSHKLRTPLNGILGFAQILQADEKLTKEQHRKIDKIYQSGEHLLTLLNDILNLSKIEANQFELELKKISFPLFIEKIISIIDVWAQQKNINFNYKALSPLPAVIRGDETRLRQVLLNLLGNAVKFTPKGSINFYVRKLADSQSTEDNKNCQIRFQIEDTGIGISKEKNQEIFLPFHQLKNDDSLNEGSGLGLTISQRIVNIMGGEIQVESTPGKGSTFYFDLCFSETENTLVNTDINLEIQPIGIKGKHPKILVIDDNQTNRAVVVNYLEKLGFEVSEAFNSKRSLVKAQNLKPKPDLILLDLVMPVMDGFETTKALRNNPKFQDVPIIIISENAMFDAQLSSYPIGCNAFLSKPIDLKLLIKSISQFLEIEWIYPQSTNLPLSTQHNHGKQMVTYLNNHTDNFIVTPSVEQINQLLHLTQIGDIEAIIEQANYLQNSDTKYSSFTKKVCELAESFQQYKLINFLEDFLK